MRVVVSVSGDSLNPQLRSYAEYRMFSTLAMRDEVRGARVDLRAEGDAVTCTVQVTLTPHRSIEARTSATHATAAVDQAAAQIAALISSRDGAVSI